MILSVVSRREGELERVVALEGERGRVGDMALERPDPALLRDHHGDRLALDHRRLDLLLAVPPAPRRRWCGAGRAACRARKSCWIALISSAIASHCLSSDLSSALMRLAFLGELVVLALDLELLELAEAAEAHVEDRLGLDVGELEPLHQHRLRLVLGRG